MHANKPDKFRIKFWLASDVDSKYIINELPYLGKDDFHMTSISSVHLSEYVVFKLIEPFTSKSLATQLIAIKKRYLELPQEITNNCEAKER